MTAVAPPPQAPPNAAEPTARSLRTPLGAPRLAPDPSVSPTRGRAIAFALLALFGGLHWMALLQPAQPGRALAGLAIAGLAAAGLLGAGQLTGARRHAAAVGVAEDRARDLLVAVNEIATNSVRHGGGSGLLLLWHEPGELVCEVSDGGRIQAPLAGRQRPDGLQLGGYGLWLANQLCDLVQVRAYPTGGVVRLRMRVA
jgi:anti-sigma regulatory factor (Ser/Thr protein kinase)